MVIIGAGWSGMAAADSLVRAGNVSFAVIESSNRTGGRTHAVAFGRLDVWRGVIERGSNWVSAVAPEGIHHGGAAGVTKGMREMLPINPVYVLAKQQNLSVVWESGGGDNNMHLYDAIYTTGGDVNGDPGRDIRTRANAALDCLNNSNFQNKGVNVNATVRTGLHECGWQPQTPEEWAMDWVFPPLPS